MRGRRGASAIEYGLISALIAVAGIVAFSAVGTQLAAIFALLGLPFGGGGSGGQLFGYWSSYDDGDGYLIWSEIDAMITDDLQAFSGYSGPTGWMLVNYADGQAGGAVDSQLDPDEWSWLQDDIGMPY